MINGNGKLYKTKQNNIIMNKNLILLVLSFILIGCKINSQKTANPINPSDNRSDSLALWGNYKYDGENILSLKEVKKKYTTKNGKLYDRVEKIFVSNITIQFRKDKNSSEDVYLKNGLPINSYYEKKSNNMDWRLINYDRNGDLSGVFAVANYETQFNKGNGAWKNYYHKDYKTLNGINFQIKEEGEVRNNFKFGEWKYYNKEGKIDSTKFYTLKDSVDVRFPHCIFNKKEPCY